MDVTNSGMPALRGPPRRPVAPYIERVGELCGATVNVVSVGPDREHTLVRTPPARLTANLAAGLERL